MKVVLLYPGHNWSTIWVADGYNNALNRLDIDVVDIHTENLIQFAGLIVAQNVDLFKQLSKANDTPESAHTWTMHLAAQLAIVRLMEIDQVDVVLNICGKMFSAQNYQALSRIPFPRVIMLTESPYEDETQKMIASYHDFATVNDRSSVDVIGKVVPTVYLRHAYDEEIYNPDTNTKVSLHNRAAADEKEYDIFWVGTPFANRKRIFDKIRQIDNIKACIMDDLVIEDKEKPGSPAGINWLPPRSSATLYNSSKINLNIHRNETTFGSGVEVTGSQSLGPRAFEIAGCAAFQLCDNTRPELREIFGDTVAVFENESDAPEAVKYWLDPSRDKLRNEMAHASQEIVYPKHTYLARAIELVEQLASWYGRSDWCVPEA